MLVLFLLVNTRLAYADIFQRRSSTDLSEHRESIRDLKGLLKQKTVIVHAPPSSLFSSTASIPFPAFECEPLVGERATLLKVFGDGITLLGCAGSKFSQEMVDSWLLGTRAAMATGDGASELNIVWLSLVDSFALGFLRRPLMAAMRMSVPPERQSLFYTYFGDSTQIRTQLKMENKFLGYVCVIDRGLVRWIAHSNEIPTDKDVQALSSLLLRAMQPKVTLQNRHRR
ncbi:hypothetical protein AB1Y20_007994 [Prymnesium parvum]|uniref:Uncharacterized protein n=1 Tax=Prymnesium parvum TaxID=97485 RepID=A0AB34IVC9_PRYPA